MNLFHLSTAKAAMALATLAFSPSLFASSLTFQSSDLISKQHLAVEASAATQRGLNFKVGDKTSHDLAASFFKGSMSSEVTQDAAEGIWVSSQIVAAGQTQKVETLYDRNNGQVLKVIVNGKEESAQKPEIEIVSMEEATIKVPAGQFDVIYIVAKNKADGKEIKIWTNPKDVPIGGMVKTIQPSQIGSVTLQLKSFQFAN